MMKLLRELYESVDSDGVDVGEWTGQQINDVMKSEKNPQIKSLLRVISNLENQITAKKKQIKDIRAREQKNKNRGI